MDSCQSHSDDVFGPQLTGCRGQFDFTLLFEHIVLSIIPSLCFIPAIAYCIVKSLRQERKTLKGRNLWVRIIKQLVFFLWAGTQLALIILWSSYRQSQSTTFAITASALSLTACLGLAAVSFLEHNRSVTPSTLVNTYLALTSLLDIAQTRTLWLRPMGNSIPPVFSTSLALKICALLLEITEKRKALKHPYREWPPEALAGILNRAIFWWINPLLLKGSRAILSLKDLFTLDQALNSENLHPRFRHIHDRYGYRGPWTLLLGIAMNMWKQLLGIAFPRLVLVGFKICQPLLLHRAVGLLSEPSSSENTNIGRALIGATALIYLGIAVTTAAYQQQTYRLIAMIRGGLIGLIYEATFSLSTTNAGESAAVTLINTDIDRIATGFAVADSLWAGPIELAIALYLLSMHIGWFCFAPAVMALFFIACASATSRYSGPAQKAWVDIVQHRVATTASVLSQIKSIRMMGISDLVVSQLHNLRVEELRISSRFRTLLSLTMVVAHMPRITILVLTILVYVLVTRATTGEVHLDAAFVFTTISLTSFVSETINAMSRAGPEFAAAVGCLGRIQEYLASNRILETVPETVEHNEKDGLTRFSISSGESLMDLNNVDFAYQSDMEPTLQDVTLNLQANTWTVILGPIGCGKSTLILGLLNELSLVKGDIVAHPSLQIAYCAQNPWLPRMSIRNIVVGYATFDGIWYETVINACLLEQDIKRLPQGDQTVVGNQSTALSGGQKQRLSLARALYSRRPLLLLDDVLRGLDQLTEKAVVENAFGRDGLCRKVGMSVVLATHSIRHASQADQVVVMGPGGKIVQQGPPDQLSLCQITDIIEPVNNLDESSRKQETTDSHHSTDSQAEEKSNENFRQTGDIKLYAYYFRAMGWGIAFGVLVSDAAFAFVLKFPTLLMQWWSNAEQKDPGVKTNMYSGVLGSLCAVCLMLIVLLTYLLLHVGLPRSSIRLHDTLLKTVMASPFWFFVATDPGQILNRFSQDMSLIDMDLPLYLLITLFDVATCIVEAGLILSASKWAALACPGIIVVLYLLQKYYLRTSRQLRLLDLEIKSPLYSYFLETLDGLTTARAFGWKDAMVSRNSQILDDSQRPYYLLYSIQRWLNLVLGLVVAALATIIMALATQLHDTSAGALGLSLVNILSFSENLASLIRSWTNLETSLAAVSRVRSFESDTPSEHLPGEKLSPPAGWPLRGEIAIQDVSVSYRSGSPPVLEGISLRIQPGEKIGICGRTGSGKSTLLLALLRLSEISHGEIFIDDVPLSSIPRNTIRHGITTISQEPVILPGTVRQNADPFSLHPDTTIIYTLEEVGLWDLFSESKGLDTDLPSHPLSHGQEQLFYLARALLRKSKIVFLDEVTSSMDTATEERMMEIMREKLAGCTVVAVAHRLKTIRDYDRVVVLDEGRIVEVGNPGVLLGGDSFFKRLWDGQVKSS